MSEMIRFKGYVAGWLDSSIHEFVASLAPDFESTQFVLITCLDSELAPASVLRKSPQLKSIASKAKVLGKGLVVPTKVLTELDARQRLFFGFDEIWFFRDRPRTKKPDSVWLVGPSRIGQATLTNVGAWMIENKCSLALGDGDGLNFIVKAHGLVRHLLAHSMQQPEPSTMDHGGEEVTNDG